MKLSSRVHQLTLCWVLAWLSRADVALGQGNKGTAANDIFPGPDVVRIAITLPAKGWEELGQSSGGSGRMKPQARATVRDGVHTYRDVAVQLKGFTTFQPLEGNPSLTLDFNQFVPGQKFHGLSKISLNNSLQDPSKLHEKFARELFTAAGVPVPQADYALVTLNGRELGLYVLVQGYGQDFLKRHFKDSSGNFYEGAVLQDIQSTLQLKSGKPDRSDVDRLLRASREPDPTRRFEALAAVLDLERFFAMVAIETMLCHSDSYSMNRNNYRLYHDPTSDRLVFLPHGMDRILGSHRSNLDLPVVPPAAGVVARAVLSTPEGRRRYVETAGTLFTNLFDAERLCHRVREMDAKILKERMRFPGDRHSWGGADRSPGEDAIDLCRRIRHRIAELKLQFAQRANLLALTPPAAFNTNGSAPLAGWRVRWEGTQAPVEVALTNRDGRPMLRVRSATNSLRTTLYSRVAVPAGDYQLRGNAAMVAPVASFLPITLVRYHASDRFTTEQRELGVRPSDFPITVSPRSAPEELEFSCEIESPSREVWLDPSTLELARNASPGRRRPRIGE